MMITRIGLLLLVVVLGVSADDSEDRRSKIPFVADAVGNALPPPHNGPASVGSPVNLITPDRYEFYTFDESGELVKRLMTLDEIQAIVAAGEETEGLVTFANENQPTIAFNFSQPPYTKVHNVVTNVQNVLKAQMEAHKNKPPSKPTLDTPDVSDSWSLILPSIFGNTGADIVPDKTSDSFNTPETETVDLENQSYNDNSLHKEGSSVINNNDKESQKDVPVTENVTTQTTQKIKFPSTRTTTPRSQPKTTQKTTPKPTTTTTKSTTTTPKPRTTSTTTVAPTTKTTTSKPKTTSTLKFSTKPNIPSSTITKSQSSTTSKPRTNTTTSKPKPTTDVTSTIKQNVKSTPKSTTAKPFITNKKTTASKPTSAKPSFSSVKPNSTTFTLKPSSAKPILSTEGTLYLSTTAPNNEKNLTKIQTFSNDIPTSQTPEKTSIYYEKISTFVPISTAAYVTERTTQKTKATSPPVVYSSTTKRSTFNSEKSTKPPSTSKIQATTYKPTTYKPLTTVNLTTAKTSDGSEKLNFTTVTTQSVSPSTTMASTEFVSIGTNSHITKNKYSTTTEKVNNIKHNQQNVQFFDISESFSQIASDLGNYQPVPTSGDLSDTSKLNDVGLESKENLEMDIPLDLEKDPISKTNISDSNYENFVEISTVARPNPVTLNPEKPDTSTNAPVTSTIDPILSGSMDDLLSQIVNQSPQTIVGIDKPVEENSKTTTKALIFFTQNTTTPQSITETPAHVKNNVTIDKIDTEKYNQSDMHSPENNKDDKPNKILNDNNLQNLMLGVNQFNNMIAKKPGTIEKHTEKVPSTVPENGSNDIKSGITNKFSSTNDSLINTDHKPVKNSTEKEELIDTSLLELSTDLPKLQAEIVKEPIGIPNKFENALSNSESSQNKIITLAGKENITEKYSEPETKTDEFKKKIQKVNIDDKELTNERNNSWKLISTVAPPKTNENIKDTLKTENKDQGNKDKNIILDYSTENQGLEVTTKNLGQDVLQFTDLCNELAFRYWHKMIETIDKNRSFVLSPYSITSMLAMIFMGARGATSGEMNEILKLDDMVTFNPHFVLKNISDSIDISPNSGVIVSAFIRELFSNRDKGKIHTFYKERANHFYNGHVEEVNFKLISDIIRRRTNLLVKRYSYGRIPEYMKSNTITMQPPLAAFSANVFQTDCSGSSVEGRDGEMYFVVSPNVRLRRLVPVPAAVYRTGFLAGYDPVLDATAAALGSTSSIVSTLFLMPGQQGNVVHTDDLEQLEKRLLESNPTNPAWNRLLRTLLPRIGLELQIPRFLHKSIFNVSSTLRGMGLNDLFNVDHADLGGIIGHTKDLHVSDMIQSSTFVTCGEGVISEQHHMEEYPETLGGPQRRRTSRWATGWEEPRDYQRAFHDPHDVGEAMHLPLHLRPRQARLPARNAQPARLKFDRPFLYFVRHNPTGMILYVGRYNPRLLP